MPRPVSWALWLVLASTSASLALAEPLDLTDGDRVVLVGGTFIERAQQYGYIETRLTAQFPGRQIVFRNLGWSGDTVLGESRAGFDTQAEGYRRLVDHVRELSPTVVVLGYGANESFAGPEGLPDFVANLTRLWNDLEETGARFIVLAPTRQERLPPPLPDPTAHNRDLRLYGRMLGVLAAQRDARHVDLFELVPDGTEESPPLPLTDNGLHYADYGYWRVAAALAAGLELPPPDWTVEFDADSQEPQVRGTTVKEISRDAGAVRFTALDNLLPTAPPPNEAIAQGYSSPPPPRLLRVRGLAPGQYTLQIDGHRSTTATADQWTAGVVLDAGPELAQVEKLRGAILHKNELYFYRWRPQNETYLFGFRKHEQGQNAQEVPKFDPLVAEAETNIADLARPREHRYELIAESEVAQ